MNIGLCPFLLRIIATALERRSRFLPLYAQMILQNMNQLPEEIVRCYT